MSVTESDVLEALMDAGWATGAVWETDEPYKLHKCPSRPHEAEQ